jgi:hypothetical protein
MARGQYRTHVGDERWWRHVPPGWQRAREEWERLPEWQQQQWWPYYQQQYQQPYYPQPYYQQPYGGWGHGYGGYGGWGRGWDRGYRGGWERRRW